MTFSIVGRCARTGMVGMAISTSSIAVTGRCVWVRGKVGAVATQNITDPALGTRILDLMAAGTPAGRAVENVAEALEFRDAMGGDAKRLKPLEIFAAGAPL